MIKNWVLAPLVLVSLLSIRALASVRLEHVGGADLRTGQPVDVKAGKKGLVVVFMSAKCPCSNSHVGILKRLAAEYGDFAFAVVHSNADENAAESKVYFEAAGFPFPVIQDEKDRLADELKAYKTPHAFVFAADGTLLYHGGVTSSVQGESADKQYLRDALSDLQAGKPVRVAEGRTLGCAISR